MDFLNEDEVYKKIFSPALDRLKSEIVPTLAVDLEQVLNAVIDRLHGATITVSIKLNGPGN